MLQIIHNQHTNTYSLVNITLGAVIDTFKTEQEAQQLKNHILNN